MTTTINNEHKKLNAPNKQEQNQTCLDSAEREGLRLKGNVPNLRFPEFHGEWEKCRLGDVCTFLSGGTPKIGIKEYWNGTIPFVSAISMHDTYILDSKLHISEEGLKHGSRLLTKDNLLLLVRGSMLWNTIPICLNKNDVAFNQDVKGIIANDTINKEFLLYWLKSKEQRLKYMVTGTGLGAGKLDTSDLLSMIVYIPAMKEQDKVARLLSLFDERIATQNKIIDKLQSLIKGLNDFLYTQYGGEVLTSFAELGTSYSGLSGKSAQDFGSGKPFITYLNVYSNNVIKENDFQYVAIKDDEKQNVVKYGDVLLTLSSETPEEVGVGSVYLGKEKVYLNSFCFGIHITNTEVAFPPYLSYYVSLTAFRKFIYPYAQGSTRFNLCKADFEKASIKLPTLENQKRIYSILSHIDNKIITERQMLDLYNSQKQYLLRQMFI